MRSPSAAAAITLLLLGACAGTPAAPEPLQQPTAAGEPTKADLERLATLVGYMAGSFDSGEQAKADPTYFDIRLHMTPIWTADGSNARWLYVEQAMANQLAKPYRQRVYRVSALGGGRFTSEVYELPGDPLAFAGSWKNPDAFANLKPDMLTARDGCVINLAEKKESFVGSTNAQDCVSTLRGAAYATSEVVISADQLVSWDRGFDAQGKQVWGATKGGYVFRKRAR